MARYYGMQQQLELVLAAQKLSEFGEHTECGKHESNLIESDEGKICGVEARNVDI
jgi:hypothetical protein